MQDYKVRLEAFEGPMDLLMHLIEKNKIDIYDIPIADLTGQYMAYLDRFKEFNLEVASEFIVMAATLLQIKSRMMLPQLPKDDDSDGEAEDPRQELVERILEYRRFKQISCVLDEMAQEQGRFFARPPLHVPVHHLPPENLSLQLLLEAFRTAVEIHEELSIPSELVSREEYSIQAKMEEIMQVLHRSGGKMRLTDVFTAGSKSELIASFLALLELMKLKTVMVQQTSVFAAIDIRIRDGGG